MKSPVKLLGAASLITLLGAGAALAQSYPASLAGQTFSVRDNDTSFSIVVSSQGTSGNCPQISGSIAGSDTLAGYYCPATGEVSFMRETSGDALQVYFGNVVYIANGSTIEMTGSFASFLDSVNGEFPFDAVTGG